MAMFDMTESENESNASDLARMGRDLRGRVPDAGQRENRRVEHNPEIGAEPARAEPEGDITGSCASSRLCEAVQEEKHSEFLSNSSGLNLLPPPAAPAMPAEPRRRTRKQCREPAELLAAAAQSQARKDHWTQFGRRLRRWHLTPRLVTFTPVNTGCPVDPDDLADNRRTFAFNLQQGITV